MTDIFEILSNILSSHLRAVGVCLFIGLAFWRIFARSRHEKAARKILHDAISSQAEPATLHPEIDPALCAGCGACTQACPEGDILRLVDHRAVLVSPSQCLGHGECEKACPTNAISLVFGTKTRGMDIPRITTHYETNIPGIYIAGELGGMGLIRNALKQGNLATQHAISQLPKIKGVADTDLLIIGAGSAGLSAALTAISEGKHYICIEQSNFGGTVYNFPRQKIVMTRPAELPLIGLMKFKKDRVQKEDLLSYWDDVRKRSGLQIQEGVRFVSLEKVGDVFHVQTDSSLSASIPGERLSGKPGIGELGLGKYGQAKYKMIRARKVILCTGVGGTPRKLGLTNEDLPKVAYRLIDPEQYRNLDLAVVGGGNSAAEAAQSLAHSKLKNRVILMVRGKSMDRCNSRNREALEKLVARKSLQIWYQSSVKEIHSRSLVVMKEDEECEILNDFLLVLAGAEMPHKFLMSLGIQMDKKFGERLENK